jgi:hypothetical protein
MSSALDEMRQAYGLDAPLAGYDEVYEPWLRRSTAAQALMRAWLLNTALIPLSPAQCAMNPFHLVNHGMLSALSASSNPQPIGAAFFWRMVNVDKIAAIATRPQAWPHFARGLDLWTDAWKYGNNSVAWALRFPSDARLGELRLQGFPASDAFAAPLCD